MITEGTVCIWQNQVGEWAWLNGVETTVLKGLHFAVTVDFFNHVRKPRLVYMTDTPDPQYPDFTLYAGPNELRIKGHMDDEDLEDIVQNLEDSGLLC